MAATHKIISIQQTQKYANWETNACHTRNVDLFNVLSEYLEMTANK